MALKFVRVLRRRLDIEIGVRGPEENLVEVMANMVEPALWQASRGSMTAQPAPAHSLQLGDGITVD